MHGVRRHLRIIGRGHRHVRPGRPAGASALRLRSGLRDGNGRGRRRRRPAHSAVDHPRRLRDRDRAEHRQAVHGGADPGPAGGRALCHRDRRSWCVLRPDIAPPLPKSDGGRTRPRPARNVAGRAGDPGGDRRHLRRRLHADRGCSRRLRRHARRRPGAATAWRIGDQGEPDPDGRDVGDDLHHPARARRSSTPSSRCHACRPMPPA